MSFFLYLLESKFRELPEFISAEAERIAEMYIEAARGAENQQFKGKKISPEWKEYFKKLNEPVWSVEQIGVTRFEDLQTNKITKFRVLVAYGKNNKDLAISDTNRRHIILYDSNCRNLSKMKLISTIYHEIVHGLQQHKEYSKKYNKLANKTTNKARAAYYIEPIEFDAFMSELALTISKEFTKHKNDIINSKLPQTKAIMQRRLEKFLKELEVFIEAPLDTYFVYKELPLPYSFETFAEMLENINKSPKHWQKFKNKLNNLLKELKNIKLHK